MNVPEPIGRVVHGRGKKYLMALLPAKCLEHLKISERTIPQILNLVLEKFRKRTFIVSEGRNITFGDFADVTNRIANSLTSAGTEKGSRVAILMGNRPEYLETWVGLAKIGGIEVPIDTELKGELLLHRLHHSGSSALVVEDRFLGAVAELVQSLGGISRIFVYPDLPPVVPPALEKFQTRPFQDLLRGSRKEPAVDVKPSDLHAIIYTSGTTGPAKGVMVPHAQWTYVAQYKNEICETTPDDVIFNCYPLHNPTGQCETSFSALMAGAMVAHVDHFSARNFWNDVRKFSATQFVYMGGILSILLKQPESSTDRDHSCRLAWGCACAKSIWGTVRKRFGIRVVEIYGMTEGWPITQYPRDSPESKIGSIGKVVDAFEAKVLDDDDIELPAGKVGEIVFRSRLPYATCLGYYNDPDSTLEVMRNLWWHSGDLGYCDADGYFYFVERKKHLIRVRGHMVSPTEIEDAINKHPKVLESVAFGVTSELAEGEEECKVMILLKDGERMNPEELLEHCQKNLPRYMVPRHVEFVKEFEKTPTMRIQRWKYKRIGVSHPSDKTKHSVKGVTQGS